MVTRLIETGLFHALSNVAVVSPSSVSDDAAIHDKDFAMCRAVRSILPSASDRFAVSLMWFSYSSRACSVGRRGRLFSRTRTTFNRADLTEREFLMVDVAR